MAGNSRHPENTGVQGGINLFVALAVKLAFHSNLTRIPGQEPGGGEAASVFGHLCASWRAIPGTRRIQVFRGG